MKAILATVVGLVFAMGLSHATDVSFGTGDRRLDATLDRLEVAANGDPDGFVRRLSSMHGFTEWELRHARDTYGLGGADLFMTTALARECERPLDAVAEGFARSRGRGWGLMAQELGIRPGSSGFQRLKRDADGSLDSMNAAAKGKQKHERQMRKESQDGGPGKSR